jgi:ribosomal protein S18 acetylase RimI-like enzyme
VNLELRWMTSGDAEVIESASYLFDDEVQHEWAEKFLRQPNHHLCIAFVDDEPAGFVSGVEITHPDKGTEMLLYELGVDDDFRRKGIGRGLAVALRDYAKLRGCTGMWVPIDEDNEPAIAMYRSTRPDEDAASRVVWWDLTLEDDPEVT